MKKLIGVIALMMLFGVGIVNAQSRQVTGTVTDKSDGSPLPGVSVAVKGTTKGTATDINGKYSINVSPKDVLVFSFVGMKDQEITVGDKKVINVKLESSRVAVEEVVVVGYGTTTKQSFTGTAKQIGEEKLAAKNTVDISKALTGEVAGVTVINSSGQPGTNATIRIRGIGSVNGNRDPLYVVDGIPYNGDISSINPSDIQSTTILKDASATAIYGARGANGVILITTKRGIVGESKIEVSLNYGINKKIIPEYNVIESPEQYVELTWEGFKKKAELLDKSDPVAWANLVLFYPNYGISPFYNMWNAEPGELINPETGKFYENISRKYTPESWEDNMFDSGKTTEAVVKLSGGNAKTNYFTSFGFLDNEGYYINSDFRRYTARLSVNHQVKEWLKGSMNIGYTYSEKNNPGQTEDSNSGFWFVSNMPPIFPVFLRDENGDLVDEPIFGGNLWDFGAGVGTGKRGFGALANPACFTRLDLNEHITNEVSVNNYLEAKITDNIKVTSRFGMQYSNISRNDRSNPFYGGAAESGGSIYKTRKNMTSYTWVKMLKFQKQFELHNLEAFVAHENSSYEYNYLSGFKSNLAHPYTTEFNMAVVSSPSSSYVYDYTLESFFGQIKYDYDNKYFAQFVIRRDGSSRFKKDKWGNFGSLGLAWLVTKEDFMSSMPWLNNLKFKVSYGFIGEQGGVGYYPGDNRFDVNNINDEVSTSFDFKGNPDLTWEKSNMFQTGIEFDIKGIVEGSFDYYIKNTDDLIFDRRVASSIGYALY